MRPRTLITALAVGSLLASACGAVDGGESDPGVATTPPSASDDGAIAEAEDAGDVTAATIEQLRSLDPEVLTGAHDHDGEGHEHHDHDRSELFDLPSSVEPERIVIPTIGVDADVIDLGLSPNGEVEVPSDFDQAGWFDETPRPGRVGVSVITGHVDSRSGPAVFFRLAELATGDRIEVHGTDGEVVEFEMREASQHAKSEFPVEDVFRSSDRPELILVTCGGVFDEQERSYRDNIIVTAERVDE